MRPRKVVLCVAADYGVLADRAFLLNVRGYQALRASSAGDAIHELRAAGNVDVLLIDLPVRGIETLLARREEWPALRVLLISNGSGFAQCEGVDGFLAQGYDSPAEILAWVRVLCARKRGPKAKDRAAESEAEHALA